MKTLSILLVWFLIFIASVSISFAAPCDNITPAAQQDFATAATANGLAQATETARSEGKSVLEIICVSLAAGFSDHAIVSALLYANTSRSEIVLAAAEAGLDMRIVTAALGDNGPLSSPTEQGNQALGHPGIPAGGTGSVISVSPATF